MEDGGGWWRSAEVQIGADATFPDLGNASQTRGTIGIFYTYLGHDRFGAVDWR